MIKKSFFTLVVMLFLVGVGCPPQNTVQIENNAKVSTENPPVADVMANIQADVQVVPAEKKMVPPPIEPTASNIPGVYEDYAESKLARATTEDVVLFFNASWCPTCRAVNADITAHLNDIPPGVNILKVDYDNSEELQKKYGVTYQHTFVQVDAKGTMIKKWSGGNTLASVLAQVQ